MRLTVVLATLAVFSAQVNAREVEIGHLESKDDPDAISTWVFLHCNENGELMICDVFSTQIAHELPPEQRATDIEKSMRGDPVKEFKDSIGKGCDKIKDAMTQAKTGKNCRRSPARCESTGGCPATYERYE